MVRQLVELGFRGTGEVCGWPYFILGYLFILSILLDADVSSVKHLPAALHPTSSYLTLFVVGRCGHS